MPRQHVLLTGQASREAVKRMWFHYYNNLLLDKKIISAEKHRRMQVMINSRNLSTD